MDPKISVVITVLNEAKSIEKLLAALMSQTMEADEIIVVDGGSSDGTQILIRKFQAKNIHLLEKNGNRSVGRNFGIEKARNDIIAITDAGCVPHRDWLEKLLETYTSSKAQVVAGYYDALPQTAFEAAVVPYVLVMPDRVDPDHFLPATRSMLLEKSVWEKVSGFDESLSDNEDFALAHKLLKAGTKMAFAADAKVTWIPRSNLKDFYIMIYRFARGDIQAGIVRKKVLLVFGRYLLGAALVLMLTVMAPHLAGPFLILGLSAYTVWAILKNFKYAPRSWYWLPVLQYTADIAVMSGSLAGWLKK